MTASLHTLSVELIYRILDHLDENTIFLSMQNVCSRLNAAIDTHRPYQVKSNFVPQLVFYFGDENVLTKKKMLLR